VNGLAAMLRLFLSLSADLLQRWWEPRSLEPPLSDVGPDTDQAGEPKVGAVGGIDVLPSDLSEPTYLQFGPVLR